MHKKLFIPGPVEVSDEVLQKLATPMIGHRSKDASALQRRISDKMRTLFQTRSQILLSTSSGSGLMEGAVRSCTARKAAIFSVGAFGRRWFEMAAANGVPADIFEVDWGQATAPEMIANALAKDQYDLITITHNETSTGIMNPVDELAVVWKEHPEVIVCLDTVSSAGGTRIDVDALGVDICITSTQKALGLPPGLSICSFSERAAERARKVPNRGYYLDLLSLYEYIQNKDYQYPSTPALSLMFALDYQLDRILEEGLEQRFARHQEMAREVREWASERFALFADPRYLSNTLTAISNTRQIDVASLNRQLGERGYQISNGYGKMKDQTFRIAHMADATPGEVRELLAAIDDILAL